MFRQVENDWFNELFRYLNAIDNLNEAIITLSLPANTKRQWSVKSRKASPGGS
jgi:hypothetical protein